MAERHRHRPRGDAFAANAWAREVQRLIETDAASFLREQEQKRQLALQRWAKSYELLREVDALFTLTARAGHGHFHYEPLQIEGTDGPVRLDLRWRGSPPERSLIVSVTAQRGLVEWGMAAGEDMPQLARRDVLSFQPEQLKDEIRKLIDHANWEDFSFETPGLELLGGKNDAGD